MREDVVFALLTTSSTLSLISYSFYEEETHNAIIAAAPGEGSPCRQNYCCLCLVPYEDGLVRHLQGSSHRQRTKRENICRCCCDSTVLII